MKKPNLIMIIFQPLNCLVGFMVFLFRKNIKKKRKLFLGFKLMFQSSFILKIIALPLILLVISSWFFGIEILINFPFSYSFRQFHFQN